MKKKLLVLCLCVLALAGCERKDAATTDPAGVGTTSVVTLSLWTTESPAFFQALGREYTASIGANNLRFKVVGFENEAILQSYLIDQMAAGQGPDVIYTNGNWIAQNRAKLVASANDEAFNATNFRNTFVQSAQDLLVAENQIWGVPMSVDSLALYYNDSHIQDRLPERNLPGRTWEEFQQDVINLSKTDNSFSRFAFAGGALGRLDNVTYGFEILENLFLQGGVSWFSPDGQQVTFQNTQGKVGGRNVNLGEQALDFYTSFADDRFRQYTWNEFVAPPQIPLGDFMAFVQGDVSMIFGYTRDLERLKALRTEQQQKRQTVIPESDIRVTFLPQSQDPSTSPTKKVVARLGGLAVSTQSQYPDTAWGFLKFAIGKDQLQSWHDATGLPTPRVDLLAEQEETPYLGIFVRQAKFAEGRTYPITSARVETEFKNALSHIETRKWSPLQALQKSADNLNRLLGDRARKLKEIES